LNGRFTTKDSWQGDYNRPLTLNDWNYVEGNPVNVIDPSGYDGIPPFAQKYLQDLRAKTEQCYLNHDTKCVYNSYYQLALFAPYFGFGHSSEHMFNYLMKGGDIDYPSGLWQPGPHGQSSRWVFEANHARHALRQATKQMWVQIHKSAMTGITSGDVKSDDFATGYPSGSTDIYYALGDYYVSVDAHYEISGCDITVKPIYRFHDIYDWHPGLPAAGAVPGVAGFQDAWAASLKPIYAQEFNITGSWNGPNKVYHFPSVWLGLPANNNKYISWEYLDFISEQMDIFHFDD